MIKPSPELVAITRRWSDAIQNKDGRTLTNLFSPTAHLSYVGTAFDEHWTGDVVRNGYADHVLEIPDFTQEELHVEAFESGGFGWALWIGLLTFSNMQNPAQIRTTIVFALEDGSWKIVQHHASNPSRNIEVIGVEHSALDDLVGAALEGFQPDQSQGTATIMFTDIANSSAIADLLGDRVWAATIQRHLDQVTQIIEGNGGQLVKSLGDGTMSTFPSARAALAAALEIQDKNGKAGSEPQLRLRIGLHTGDVIQSKNDFFGTVVNKAARIASAALPDEVRISDATKAMAGNDAGFSYDDPTEISLKGLTGTHVIYQIASQ